MDAGALDESVYNSMVAEGKLDKTKVRVFYTSKPFLDYVWAARKDVSKEDQEKFARAFTDLQEEMDDQVLGILRGKRNFSKRASRETPAAASQPDCRCLPAS